MRPLSNLTVLDLTVNTPGPYCSMILSDLGARVIKVEPPSGDPLRSSSDAMFASMNRGKESIALDLKDEGDREVLYKLSATADVVLEGSRPGVAKRLGADYATLSRRNPKLVYCSISGFGQDGPWRERPGHDLNYLALSGVLGLQTKVEGRPWPPAILISDLASGLYAAIAALAAINGRSVSGQGTNIDLSMTQSALSLLGLEIGGPSGADVGGPPNVTYIPTYGLFACADGRWLSLGIVHEDHFWRRLCGAAGLDDLANLTFAERVKQADQIKDTLESTFAAKPADEWEIPLLEADVPVAAVRDLHQLFDLPQFRHRGAFVDIDVHRFVAQPMKFSSGPIEPTHGPPRLDEHRNAILTELGYTA